MPVTHFYLGSIEMKLSEYLTNLIKSLCPYNMYVRTHTHTSFFLFCFRERLKLDFSEEENTFPLRNPIVFINKYEPWKYEVGCYLNFKLGVGYQCWRNSGRYLWQRIRLKQMCQTGLIVIGVLGKWNSRCSRR